MRPVVGSKDHFVACHFPLVDAEDAPLGASTAEVAILYGAFFNTIIQFLIVAFVVFLMVKMINSLRRQDAQAPAEPAGPTPTETLLTEIRDQLKQR